MSSAAPLEWLLAESVAFPLASPGAFTSRVRSLERHAPGGRPSGPSDTLAMALAAHLRQRARGVSEELLRHVRDEAWFDGLARETPLAALIERHATRHLVVRDGGIGLRTDGPHAPDAGPAREDIATRAYGWRWLSLALPVDLMCASVAATRLREPPDEHVSLATPNLARVLERGCAETHLHVGAAVPFEQLWTGWMTSPPLPDELRKLREALPFGGRTELATMLAAAALARLVMGWFLDPFEAKQRFKDFWKKTLLERIDRAGWHRDPTELFSVMSGAIACVNGRAGAWPGPTSAAFRAALRRVDPTRPRMAGADLSTHDPLRHVWKPAPGVGLPETCFMTAALRALRANPGQDPEFAETFWQYQRIRVQMYRYLVEEPGTAGLDWFQRHYARISPLRKALEHHRYASALGVQSKGLRLHAIEMRTSPTARWIEVRNEIRDVAAQALAHASQQDPVISPPPEVGMILHFVKSADPELSASRRKLPSVDPLHSSLGTRFGYWYRRREQEAQAIARCLDVDPRAIVILRGFDVASKEVAVPTWVLGPLFQRVREAGERASRRLALRHDRWRVTAPRVTVHAGEDYRRLMEGLRRIHEAAETGLLRVGDRIGHGLALGYDPDRYARESPCVLQPLEERLDDLLWELDRQRRGDCEGPLDRVEYLRAEAVRLAREQYGDHDTVDLDLLIEARRRRHCPAELLRLGYPRAPLTPAPGSRADAMLARYLSDVGVYARGQRLVKVHITPAERRSLALTQGFLTALLGRMEVTVETNPTSNLVIGDLGSLDAHPVFRLCPLHPASASERVSVSINTDNPVTFGSCLADEFAYLHHALLGVGLSAPDALRWIDAARESGLRSRFTLPASRSPDILTKVAGDRARRGASPR